MTRKTPDGFVARLHSDEEPLTTADGAVVHTPAVRYRLGGFEYGAKFGPNCAVCNSDHRVEIERALIIGAPPRRIQRDLAARGVEVSFSSIEHHLSGGHMPLDQTVRRIALEERVKELGQGLEDIESTLVDHIGLLREVQRRTYERMASGEIEPDVGDGLAAAKILATINRDNNGQSFDWEIMRDAISQMMVVARSVMDDDTWTRYTRGLQSNPVLRSIDAALRQQGALEVPEDAP